LTQAYRQEKLVLVLGGGISLEYKLPSWPSLLQGVLFRTLQKEPKDDTRIRLIAEVFTALNPNPLVAARYPRLNHSKESFLHAVRSVIYARLEEKYESELLKQIREIAAAPARGRIWTQLSRITSMMFSKSVCLD
jgi:hypothetical protein